MPFSVLLAWLQEADNLFSILELFQANLLHALACCHAVLFARIAYMVGISPMKLSNILMPIQIPLMKLSNILMLIQMGFLR
jgi:hypothetical protein